MLWKRTSWAAQRVRNASLDAASSQTRSDRSPSCGSRPADQRSVAAPEAPNASRIFSPGRALIGRNQSRSLRGEGRELVEILKRLMHRAASCSAWRRGQPRSSGTARRNNDLSPPEFRGDVFDWFPTFSDGARFATSRLACSCSYSAGGTAPSEVCRRSLLNQATYSTTASSSWERVRQTRSRISSVLKLSTKLSAAALTPL
jgi:hypothetical protein